MTTTATGERWANASLTDMVTPAVSDAVAKVRSAFTDHPVYAWPDGQLGAVVVIENLDLGSRWATTTSWLGFVVSYLHPEADCYPHHMRGDLQRADGQPLNPPFHPGRDFAGRPAVMVSRSSRRRDPRLDTPARKALSVLEFVQRLT